MKSRAAKPVQAPGRKRTPPAQPRTAADAHPISRHRRAFRHFLAGLNQMLSLGDFSRVDDFRD